MRSLRNFASLLVEVSGFILGFVMLMLFETAWRITTSSTGGGMSRKPPLWMRRLAPPGNPAHLVPVVCSCGRWVFSERDVVWQTWDAGIITGDDLITAIILGRSSSGSVSSRRRTQSDWKRSLGRWVLVRMEYTWARTTARSCLSVSNPPT